MSLQNKFKALGLEDFIEQQPTETIPEIDAETVNAEYAESVSEYDNAETAITEVEDIETSLEMVKEYLDRSIANESYSEEGFTLAAQIYNNSMRKLGAKDTVLTQVNFSSESFQKKTDEEKQKELAMSFESAFDKAKSTGKKVVDFLVSLMKKLWAYMTGLKENALRKLDSMKNKMEEIKDYLVPKKITVEFEDNNENSHGSIKSSMAKYFFISDIKHIKNSDMAWNLFFKDMSEMNKNNKKLQNELNNFFSSNGEDLKKHIDSAEHIGDKNYIMELPGNVKFHFNPIVITNDPQDIKLENIVFDVNPYKHLELIKSFKSFIESSFFDPKKLDESLKDINKFGGEKSELVKEYLDRIEYKKLMNANVIFIKQWLNFCNAATTLFLQAGLTKNKSE